MVLSLYDHEDGVETSAGTRVVYDVERNEAHFGAAGVAGYALRWELEDEPGLGARLSATVDLHRADGWLMRCDRVDFPPGGVAFRHTHPGPGIRCLLFGSIRIDAAGGSHTYGPSEAWFEAADFPVLATASADADTAFVRVLLLPAEWAGRRTIRYLDPVDEEKPKLQRATVLLEQPLDL